MEWSVAGIAAVGASAPPGAQLSGMAADPAGAALTQAMASFGASAAANSAPVPVLGTAEQSQQTLLYNTTRIIAATFRRTDLEL